MSAYFQCSEFLNASSRFVSSMVPAVTRSYKCTIRLLPYICISHGVAGIRNTYSTFRDIVTTKLAVLAGMMWEGKLNQIEHSLHLTDSGLHVVQPDGGKAGGKGSEGNNAVVLLVGWQAFPSQNSLVQFILLLINPS